MERGHATYLRETLCLQKRWPQQVCHPGSMREPLAPTRPQGVVVRRKKFLAGIRSGRVNALGGGVTGATGAPKLPHRSIEQPGGVFP